MVLGRFNWTKCLLKEHQGTRYPARSKYLILALWELITNKSLRKWSTWTQRGLGLGRVAARPRSIRGCGTGKGRGIQRLSAAPGANPPPANCCRNVLPVCSGFKRGTCSICHCKIHIYIYIYICIIISVYKYIGRNFNWESFGEDPCKSISVHQFEIPGNISLLCPALQLVL